VFGNPQSVLVRGQFRGNNDEDGLWRQAMETANPEDCLTFIRDNLPKQFFLHFNSIQSACQALFAKTLRGEYETPQGWNFNINQQFGMLLWLAQRIPPAITQVRVKSLILWGPSRTGKTAWARSIGRHCYFNAYFSLSEFILGQDTAEYAIFDDLVDFDKWTTYKQWIGCQHQFILTDKYMPKSSITWGKPCIVLMNKSPASLAWDYDWIQANAYIVNVQTTLY